MNAYSSQETHGISGKSIDQKPGELSDDRDKERCAKAANADE